MQFPCSPLNSLSLVGKFSLLWLFCAVWISLGYWWGLSEHGASECQTLPFKVGSWKQLPNPGKILENLVCWSCWKVSLALWENDSSMWLHCSLIWNFLQWKCNPVLTKICSRGRTCLWLSEVSHSLCRKLAFLTPVIMVLAGTLLERCWYLVDLLIYFSSCPQKKQTQIFFFLSSLKRFLA